MKPLQITFFLLAAAIFLTQTVRHTHLLVFGGELSVLDQFASDYSERKKVQEERSTEVLLQEYREVAPKIFALEEGKGKSYDELKPIRDAHPKLYEQSDRLRGEISLRETRRREIRDLWLFCGAGMIMIPLGGCFMKRGWRWVGMSVAIPGFLELLWWSSPSFSFGGAAREYQLLLWNKIGLSVIGIVLLYASWVFAVRDHDSAANGSR